MRKGYYLTLVSGKTYIHVTVHRNKFILNNQKDILIIPILFCYKILQDVKFIRLGWAGHIKRMGEQGISKKVLNGNFHTARPVGRPRNRWADMVQRDPRQLLRIRGWRSKAANRDEWRRLMREAKTRKGL